MNSRSDVVIVGGGVIGIACAHYLLKAGATVCVLEDGQIGHGASHGNCGLLYFSDVIPLCSPGAVKKEILRFLSGTSPLYIKPRFDPALFIWLTKFAIQCRKPKMERTARAKYELLSYSADLFDSLFEETCLDFESDAKGILTVFKDREEFEKFFGTANFLNRFGFEYQALDKDSTLETEPALAKDILSLLSTLTADPHLSCD